MDVSVTGLNNAFLILPMIYTVQENVYVIFWMCVCVDMRMREREPVFALMWKSDLNCFHNFL